MARGEPQDDVLPYQYDLDVSTVIENQIAIVLHLFRKEVRIVTKTISIVTSQEVNYLIVKCRENLERRGFSQFAYNCGASTQIKKQAA